jgi:lipopolysaccharide export system protein LptA
MKTILAAAVLAMAVTAIPVLAEDAKPAVAAASATTTAPSKPTDVTADEMQILDKEKLTTFKGNVVAVRDKTTIKSPVLTVQSVARKQPDGTEKDVVDVIKATGGVKIVTDKDTITSDWATIYDQKNLLEAGGHVVLVQGTTTLKGEKLNINLDTNETHMSGGRVNLKALP